MQTAALLFPLSDFPDMLPGCLPTGLVLLITALVPLAALILRFVYYRRRERVELGIRVRGKVAGVPEGELVYEARDDGSVLARPFQLRGRDGDLTPVVLEGALVPSRRTRIRGGQAVTVLAVRGMVPRWRETLFRESALESGLQALAIAHDRRGLVRGITWTAVVGWLALAGRIGYWQDTSSQGLAAHSKVVGGEACEPLKNAAEINVRLKPFRVVTPHRRMVVCGKLGPAPGSRDGLVSRAKRRSQ